MNLLSGKNFTVSVDEQLGLEVRDLDDRPYFCYALWSDTRGHWDQGALIMPRSWIFSLSHSLFRHDAHRLVQPAAAGIIVHPDCQQMIAAALQAACHIQ